MSTVECQQPKRRGTSRRGEVTRLAYRLSNLLKGNGRIPLGMDIAQYLTMLVMALVSLAAPLLRQRRFSMEVIGFSTFVVSVVTVQW